MEVFTQACPPGKPSDGPFSAASWPAIHPGSVLFGSAAAQTVSSTGGDPVTGVKYDPIAGGEAGGTSSCSEVSAADAQGTANYEGAPVKGAYTLLGLPTVSAHVKVSGQFGQLDSRLWDVAPNGHQTLISRGAYRLLDNQDGDIVFQLHGNAWRFGPGHRPKLELVGQDPGYLRPSNGSFSVQVTNVTVELPTRVRAPARPADRWCAPESAASAWWRAPVTRARAPGCACASSSRTFPARRPIPVAGARILFAGHRLRTDSHGRASLKIRLRHRHKAIARRSGLLSASRWVGVRRR